ncbi:hypothetical protein D3C76_1166730 [compost metagenome]|uniref:hypothetical protein n=1 Tax=Pseudomonas mosselii TaxID=78327 RepID=UPI000FA36099|nr:hypothetical protein [Pseudomonas mosselii]MCL8299409.1 hypothetical protein [Pseudomonas mosselii]MCL8339735.1 hypothetical protein [Pseudomonas mosselii]
MEKEYVEAAILPIFAKACAEALRDPVDNMLNKGMTKPEIFEFADAAGKLYASAFAHLRDSFLSSHYPESSPAPSSAPSLVPDSNQAADPQASEASLCPELLSLLKTQKSTQERIDQLLAR